MKTKDKDLDKTGHSQRSFLKETQSPKLPHTDYVKSYNELKKQMNHNKHEIIDESPKYSFVVDWVKEK